MYACAVRSCRNEPYKRPDLYFYNLPRQNHLKDEWLEILGIEPGENRSEVKVCELHFKSKDFATGKKLPKQLKSHAVPVLKLGRGKSEPIDSDDEFMGYNSDGGEEIVEIPTRKLAVKSENNEAIKKEPAIEEVEEGRRPSRRAAREAAKKIYNTVRNFNPRSDDTAFSPTSTSVPSQPQQRQRRRSFAKIGPPVCLDLVMECHEEILSPVQAETLLKAQLEYNMVMKTLRSLKANNVKIICSKEPYPTVSQASAGSNSSVVVATTNSTAQKSPIVPMILSSNTLSITQASPVVA